MLTNYQKKADLFTFTKEIRNTSFSLSRLWIRVGNHLNGLSCIYKYRGFQKKKNFVNTFAFLNFSCYHFFRMFLLICVIVKKERKKQAFRILLKKGTCNYVILFTWLKLSKMEISKIRLLAIESTEIHNSMKSRIHGRLI